MAGVKVRAKALTRVRPRNRDQAAIASTPRVVVLIPPAHEPGEPPTNMRISSRKVVAGARAPTGTVLNPAVRGVTPWNRLAQSFSSQPIPASTRSRSSSQKAPAPTATRTALTARASLVWTARCTRCPLAWTRS